ncbi:hypothetical protein JJV70_01040 [Streptomyces sp. JJ66]|uniref:hypothetical protein n=1 Tax=Streptomyces sp. JJ66 TaxID=2803843 RepID=UPI001C55FE61|nr:hypothetical protein [Streptomyces sp. JJ66]MBW1600715.1 hypothetical protein [Streptomyces sp. JJ66]
MFPYIGSGPYCFSNSLAMALGPGSPGTPVLEVLTGSPFGFQLLEGTLPLFDPFGWDPEHGLESALGLLGWECRRTDGKSPEEAEERLRRAVEHGPVLAGPLEMGLLLQQPGSGKAVGADHFVLVVAVERDTVVFHDPHGHPWATLPVPDFLAAWQAEQIDYVDRPFVMRTGFTRIRDTSPAEALRASLPRAAELLRAHETAAASDLPPGSLGGAAGLERLAEQVAEGLDPDIRHVMESFSLRAGARRTSDAAACLAGIGFTESAGVLTRQARILGGLQYPLVTLDDAAVVAGLRRLAPTYEELRTALLTELARQEGAAAPETLTAD